MKQIKRLTLGFLLTFMTITTWGAKAISTPIQVLQTDGTTLVIYLHGDENFSWTTTADGVLLAQVGKSYYIASVSPDGNLVATSQLAHNADMRSAAETKLAKKQDKRTFFRYATKSKPQTRISIGTDSPAFFPHSGTPKALVLLVEFTDVKFKSSDPKATFEYYLNSKPGDAVPAGNDINQSRNHGSVAQYFKDMSNGAFIPQFDLFGPFTMPETSAYYGKGRNDQHYNEMIAKACELADAAGVDFSQYDQNGDGDVDLVYVIYAGYGASVSGDEDDLWPKSGPGAFGTYDGVNVRRFGINNELNYKEGKIFGSGPQHRINGIGLFCHEFSHTMGLPDLYPIDPSAQLDNQAMEYWDLMDGGEYVDNGYTPTPYTPWEMEVMGWLNLTELNAEGHYSLQPFNEERKAYKIESGLTGNSEYLILQNIQNNGWWAKLLGHGMLIYRIDYPEPVVSMGDYPNNIAGKPGVTLVAADGLVITSYRVYDPKTGPTEANPYSRSEYKQSHYGDPYPGKSNVTRVDSIKLNGGFVRKPIYNITETSGIIAFDFRTTPQPTGIFGIETKSQIKDEKIYTLDGRYVGTNPTNLPKGIYIYQHKKYVVE